MSHATLSSDAVTLIRVSATVGKSRLVEEFVDRVDVPHLFFAASGRPVREELRPFAREVAVSDLPGAALFDGVELSDWDAALPSAPDPVAGRRFSPALPRCSGEGRARARPT
jgi:hypothetical protein